MYNKISALRVNKILIISTLFFVLASCSDKVVEKIEETTTPVNNVVVEEIEENKVEKIVIKNEILEIFVSMQEVEKHNKNIDCYTVLDWKVYDVSSFFWKHPGWDDNLSKTCGIDATELFEWQHWNDVKAQMKKDEFYIGDLEK